MATKDSCTKTGRILRFWILILGFLPLALAMTNASNISDHDLEIMNLLKKLNKSYVKFIKSPDGDIIDCVPIHLQPAFDNPLLKNCTIQMQPSSYPKGYTRNHSSNGKLLTQAWHVNGMCPKGTTPIRRTTKEDILRAKSIQSYGKKTRRTFPHQNSSAAGRANDDDDDDGHEYAIRVADEGKYYGTKADMSVWNPSTEISSEFSLAQFWVSAGDYDVDLNTIEVGWQVYRDFYGDDRTHLFGYWTRDSYQSTGCYNLVCDAFVQTSNALGLGSVISPTSSYGGDQNEITLFLYKDRRSGNWWLDVGGESIGYWPDILFTHLREHATSVEWGGEVINKAANDGRHTTTTMGSGHFSAEGYQKAAYFKDILVVDEPYTLTNQIRLGTSVTDSNCYDLESGKTDSAGNYFFFGGPGRNPNCP